MGTINITDFVAFSMSFYVARRKEYLMERDLYQSIPHDLEEAVNFKDLTSNFFNWQHGSPLAASDYRRRPIQ